MESPDSTELATVKVSDNTASIKRYEFAAKMMKSVARTYTHENLIFSPASIQASLALLYLGADGKTAEEINRALLLGNDDKDTIVTNYGNFLKANFNKELVDISSVLECEFWREKVDLYPSTRLNLANGLFFQEGLQIAPEFQKLAENTLNAEIKATNFINAEEATKNINSWVESKTDSKIVDLLPPDAVNDETGVLLLNVIYFKGMWDDQFKEDWTQESDFYLDTETKVTVEMMSDRKDFCYAFLKEFDMKVLALFYAHTNLSMYILLPNRIDGLKDLENNLDRINLYKLDDSIRYESVEVYLPKFKITTEMDLKSHLAELGVSTVFTENANLSGLFNDNNPMNISNVKHKACLRVNEFGSESKAGAFYNITFICDYPDDKIFRADHPFMFLIRNQDAVFFIGHVTKF